MTKQRVYNVKCRFCGEEEIRCPSCNEKLRAASPFSEWLRQLPGDLSSKRIDNQNLDYIWHKYSIPSWFITMEEKQYGATSNFAQKDTHGMIAQLLQIGSDANIPIKTERGKKKLIEYRGHFIISFENTNPDNSKWIKINGNICNKNDLLYLLKNGFIPVTVSTTKQQDRLPAQTLPG